MNSDTAEAGRESLDSLAQLTDGCQHCLQQYEELLADLSPSEFTARTAPQSSISAHIRHVLERFQSVLDGLPRGLIDYDDRRRDPAMESDPQAAVLAFASVRRRVAELVDLDVSQTLSVGESVHPEHGPVQVTSTLERELMGLVSHSTHHLAIISMALRARGHQLDPKLGKAPSTLINEGR